MILSIFPDERISVSSVKRVAEKQTEPNWVRSNKEPEFPLEVTRNLDDPEILDLIASEEYGGQNRCGWRFSNSCWGFQDVVGVQACMTDVEGVPRALQHLIDASVIGKKFPPLE